MKTILAATDYSNAGTNALYYAAALAGKTNAKLFIYNSFKIPALAANTILSSTGISALVDENKVKLQFLASSLSKQYGIAVEPICNISYVAEEISHLVKKLKADLVVMGMRGKNAEYGYFGSVTSYVIGQASFPVLAVPEEVGYQGIGRILFACDYNCLQPENKLPLLKELALTFKAKVEVLHVKKIQEPVEIGEGALMERASGMEHVLKGVDHLYHDLSDDHILTGIERGLHEFEADLLVMVPHHTGFWNTIFNRSKTRKMALRTHVPLLSIPNSAQKS